MGRPAVLHNHEAPRARRGSEGFPKVCSARNDLQSIGNATRRTHNLRVLDKFESSPLMRRKLQPLSNTRYSARLDSLEIRLSPDIQALEDGELVILYFNCRTAPVPDEIASFTVEIANLVLEQNEVDVAFEHVQVIDLVTGLTNVNGDARRR